jgi:DNA-binding NarL/FixJ family response regulator
MSITCSQSVNGRQGYKAGISAAHPTVTLVRNPAPVAIHSDSEDLTHVIGVLNKGAKEYIPTNLPPEDAVEAIRQVAAEGVFLPASCRATLSGGGAAGSRDAVKQIFTARQAAMADGVREGKVTNTTTYALNLRESTVWVHIRNNMKKLNAKNRTEVAYIATNLENAGWL